MKTLLRRDGDKYIVEIDKETVDGWAIDPESPIEITAMGDVLALYPAESPDIDGKLDSILRGLVKRYDESLKKMAE